MVDHQTFDSDGDLLLLLLRHPKKVEKAKQEKAEAKLNNNSPGNENTNAQPEANNAQAENPKVDAAVENPSSTTPEGSVDDEANKEDVISPEESTFKAMLQYSNFKEGKELQLKGKVEVPLPDDYPDAFAILFDITHGRNRKVPRKIDLKTMASISVLVDKYQMLESLEMFSDIWINKLRSGLPKNFYDEVTPWLGIAWVFRKDVEFKHLTSILEQEGTEILDSSFGEGVPVPEVVLQTIKQHRQETLFNIYAIVDQTMKRYQREETLCPRKDGHDNAFDAMLLGSLLKSAVLCGFWPPPEPPYPGVCFVELADRLEDLEVMALCDKISRVKVNDKYPPPAHGLKDLIKEMIADHEKKLCGFNINDFGAKKKQEDKTEKESAKESAKESTKESTTPS